MERNHVLSVRNALEDLSSEQELVSGNSRSRSKVSTSTVTRKRTRTNVTPLKRQSTRSDQPKWICSSTLLNVVPV